MRVLIFLILLMAGCKAKMNESLLGKWQILRLQGKDSTGKDVYVYDNSKDTSKKYVSFINDTTYVRGSSDSNGKNAVDTARYLLVGDSLFSKRGIRNYSLKMVTSDSVLITGDDQSSITIVRVERND